MVGGYGNLFQRDATSGWCAPTRTAMCCGTDPTATSQFDFANAVRITSDGGFVIMGFPTGSFGAVNKRWLDHQDRRQRATSNGRA